MKNNINQVPLKTDPAVDKINEDIQHYRENHFAMAVFNGFIIVLCALFAIWIFFNFFYWIKG